MNTSNLSQLPAAQFREALQKLADGLQPDAPRRVATLQTILEPYREVILEQRSRFKWETIANMLKDRSIGIEVAPSTLRRLMSKRRRKRTGRPRANGQ